jgi:hypothetical protein
MISFVHKVARSLDKLSLLAKGIEVIEEIVGRTVGKDEALRALQAISAIIGGIRQGLDDRLDPAEVKKHLDKLKADLAANDAAADAKLRAKFGGEF